MLPIALVAFGTQLCALCLIGKSSSDPLLVDRT
jgi:hypothetical protein